MNIIFLGAPGAGKGTQAEKVSEKLSIPTVSTGNIIREALRTGTEMGLKAKSYIEAGKLVPDDVVIGIIKDRLADDKIAARMSGRRVCPACGASYHLEYKKPEKDGVCNLCSAELVQRRDDAPETVLERLKVYHEETEPLKDYYAKTGKLRIVEGQEDVAETTKLTFKALED